MSGSQHIRRLQSLCTSEGLTLAGCLTPTLLLSYSPSSKGWRKKNTKKPMSQDEDKEVTYQLWSQAKQTWPWESEFNLLPIKIDLDSEKPRQNLKYPPNLLFFPGSVSVLIPNSSISPHLQVVKRGEEWDLWLVHSSSSLLLLLHTFPLLQLESFLWAAVLHEQLQCGSSRDTDQTSSVRWVKWIETFSQSNILELKVKDNEKNRNPDI